MKSPNISKQILIIATLPVLFVAIFLTAYFINIQFIYISEALNNHGKFITKELSSSSEYAIYSGNTDSISALVNSIIHDKNVLRVQIQNHNKLNLLDVVSATPLPSEQQSFSIFNPLLLSLFQEDKVMIFTDSVYSSSINNTKYDGNQKNKSLTYIHNQIGQVIVTLTTEHAKKEKVALIKNGIFLTLSILLATLLLILRISHSITKPIQSLTKVVKEISTGNLNTPIEANASGEIGVLQQHIQSMADELIHIKSDMEEQLSQYTIELQETLEELEVRNVELDLTRGRAISANKAKSEFLANMSHEIRTPLSGIIGFTELLEGTKLSKQQDEYTQTIKKSANNLLAIINDILDLSKIESGKTEIHTSEFKLIDIIEDIVNLLIPAAYEKNIELLYHMDSHVPELIHADPFRIHQIITNLLGNAIKFTENGYVYLQITADKTINDTCNLKFTVADTGIGMNHNDKKKLFKAFTQADATITRRFGGTGLGLIISKKLTQLMKGEIGFDSTLGEGSTFWFKIPVTNVKQANISPTNLVHKRIGIISTHVIVNQIFKSLLHSWHCQTDEISLDSYCKKSTDSQMLDGIIIHVGRKDLHSEVFLKKLKEFQTSIPHMLTVSTRSRDVIKSLAVDENTPAIFSFEKTELFKKKLSNIIENRQQDITSTDSGEKLNHTNNWSHINVLLVDDNKINLRLAEIILSKNNINITTAFSGEQALDYAQSKTFDIIFMDLHMPGIDGYETSRQIHQTKKNAKTIIIALTANAMPQDTETIKQSGMSDIIIKPVNDKIMHDVLHKWLPKNRILNSADFSNENQINSENNIFSLNIAKEFTNKNETLAIELFNMLRAELDDYASNIKLAIANKDIKILKQLIHKLHGASRCCGTTNLKNTCYSLENSLSNEINSSAQTLLQSLLNDIKELKDFKL